jgi:hypothetical protein
MYTIFYFSEKVELSFQFFCKFLSPCISIFFPFFEKRDSISESFLFFKGLLCAQAEKKNCSKREKQRKFEKGNKKKEISTLLRDVKKYFRKHLSIFQISKT